MRPDPDVQGGCVLGLGSRHFGSPSSCYRADRTDAGEQDDVLATHIGEREMLLLIDNLEQVVEAAPELSRLLSLACSNLSLL